MPHPQHRKEPELTAGECRPSSGAMTSAGIGEPHTLPTTQLHLFHKNARRGDVDSIAGSLAAHGQFRPIDADTNQPVSFL